MHLLFQGGERDERRECGEQQKGIRARAGLRGERRGSLNEDNFISFRLTRGHLQRHYPRLPFVVA